MHYHYIIRNPKASYGYHLPNLPASSLGGSLTVPGPGVERAARAVLRNTWNL